MDIPLKGFIAVAKALREPNRVKILKVLQHGELCVCGIQVLLGISQATASKHLSILTTAGLVEYRKEGLWVYYRLAGSPGSPYASTLLGNLKYWLEQDKEVVALVKKIPEIRNNKLCGVSFYEHH